MKPSEIDWIWRWGVGTRLAAIVVLCSLFLPWCGDLKGIDLMKMEGFERLWWFPVASFVLLLLPFVSRRWWRFLLEFLATAGIAGGAIYLALRFRTTRGVGLTVAMTSGVMGAVMALLGACWAKTAPPPAIPDPDDTEDQRTETP